MQIFFFWGGGGGGGQTKCIMGNWKTENSNILDTREFELISLNICVRIFSYVTSFVFLFFYSE